ncbi:MAG: flagellar basal body rod protein FlgB [Zoogloeaceae bacterium]|jgi:flagellar basal-body rod protein FlgB|nr:flagellar basal body rod protein FlgB [Zoogloeaceae bacterium]
MIGDLQGYVGVYKDAMSLRAYRQEVLASNIANADTPNYKARDFDFAATFAAARGNTGQMRIAEPGAVSLSLTNPAHIAAHGQSATEAAVRLQYRNEFQPAVDGNTVEMDVERAAIADNALQYQVMSNFLSDKLSGLRTAISANS